jgi:negative regulator of genetic competence, sporulation and motility
VIVVGDDAAQVGATVKDLESRGMRAAAFVGDPAKERDQLVEMLAELFPRRAAGEAEPA